MSDFTPAEKRIRTADGNWFWYDRDDLEGINAFNVAHALSLTCRFGGHVPWFYSVAQHSVLVADQCSPENKLWALIHDAGEFALPDVPRPAKSLLPDYQALEQRILNRVARYFGLIGTNMPVEVKTADLVVLAAEARDLFGVDNAIDEWGLPVRQEDVDLVPRIKAMLPVRAHNKFLIELEKNR